MKNKRFEVILSCIENNDVETQEELVRHLQNAGLRVAQATISRDIKELGLIKVSLPNGRYKYALPPSLVEKDVSEKMHLVFQQSIVSVDSAINTIVIKTISGMAQAAACAVDALSHPDIVGCLAGDDTIFIVTRDEAKARKLVHFFLEKAK